MSSPLSADADASAADLGDAALTRLVLRAVGAAIALLLAAGLVAVAERVDDEGDGAASSAADADDPALLVPSRGIGPLPGQPVEPYIQARTTELSRVDGNRDRVAVVSFAGYVTAADARDALGAAADDVEVEAIVVAAPGGEPAALAPSALRAWAETERERAAEERAELERLLPTVDDPDFARTYRDDITRLAALERDVDAAGDVVFAVVVVGPSRVLQRIAEEDGVRLVDVGRGADVPRRDEVTALRPEESVKAGEPRYRPSSA